MELFGLLASYFLQKGDALVIGHEFDGALIRFVVLSTFEIPITEEDFSLPFDLLTELALEQVDRHRIRTLELLLRHGVSQ